MLFDLGQIRSIVNAYLEYQDELDSILNTDSHGRLPNQAELIHAAEQKLAEIIRLPVNEGSAV
jgi:hypothetical protein